MAKGSTLISPDARAAWFDITMSTRIDKDETVNIQEKDQLDPNSENFAELVFSHGISVLEWSDIANTPFVCKAWNKFCTGPLLISPHYGRKLREKFSENYEVMNKFAAKRAAEDINKHQQCMLLILEAQMLLVIVLLLSMLYLSCSPF